MGAAPLINSSSDRRWSRSNPCAVCEGFQDDSRGKGTRYYRFPSSDGRYLHCTPEQSTDKRRVHGRECERSTQRVAPPGLRHISHGLLAFLNEISGGPE